MFKPEAFVKEYAKFFFLSYIDAGTGSLIIQIVIGVLAGGLLSLKLFWAKIRGVFKKQDQTVKAEHTAASEIANKK